MTVSLNQLRAIFPKIDSAYLLPINETMDRYKFNTKSRRACFLAQTGHESAYFMRFEENLNYSVQGLLATFPKYFTAKTAPQYARNPMKIANLVYANRMGNGNTASGDGWTFRGKGGIQITGRDNHTRFAHEMGMKLEDSIQFLLQPRGAVLSAGWFCNTFNFNELADANDMKSITKKINGGTNGIDQRIALYKAGMAVL